MFPILKKYGLKTALSNMKLKLRNWSRRYDIWPYCLIASLFILILCVIVMLLSMIEIITYNHYECPTIRRILVPEVQARELTVQEMIKSYAHEYGVNVSTALRIAKCESNFNPLAKNPNSSAKGIYQFTKGTWENYCEGNVLSAESNIECFVKLYPAHKSWWECR